MNKRSVNKSAILIAILVVFIGCGAYGNSSVRPDSAEGSSAERVDCTKAGPLACAVAPIGNLNGDACIQLQSCLMDRALPDGQTVTQFTSCAPPTSIVKAPSADAPIKALATMGVELESDGPPSNAVFVLVQDEYGWCPAAVLLEPLWQHGGYCESAVEYRWPKTVEKNDAYVTIQAERVCHMPLDAAELETGVSDVAEHECVTARYEIRDGSLHQLSVSQADGACSH